MGSFEIYLNVFGTVEVEYGCDRGGRVVWRCLKMFDVEVRVR